MGGAREAPILSLLIVASPTQKQGRKKRRKNKTKGIDVRRTSIMKSS
jgi:hypothetical protein